MGKNLFLTECVFCFFDSGFGILGSVLSKVFFVFVFVLSEIPLAELNAEPLHLMIPGHHTLFVQYTTQRVECGGPRTRHQLTESESESHSVISNYLEPHGLYSSWNPPGQNTGVGSLYLLQGIFPTLVLNLGLPHCRQILY